MGEQGKNQASSNAGGGDAQGEGKGPTPQAQLIIAVVRSLERLFEKMMKTKSKIGPPEPRLGKPAVYDVSGVVHFSGQFEGSVVLSFELEAAKKLVKSFAGMDIDPHDSSFGDAVGELTNIVAGGAKRELNYRCDIRVPVVLLGQGHTVTPAVDSPSVIVPCDTEAGKFAVSINLRPVKAAA